MKSRHLSSKFYDTVGTHLVWNELISHCICNQFFCNPTYCLFCCMLCCCVIHPFTSIYIRENSIEYNQPTLQPAKSNTPVTTVLCCGHSPTNLIVRDQISTVYFDDVLMDSVRNDTRSCNPLHTFCCGGRGEEVRLESRFCWDMCYRGRAVGTEQCGLLNSCCCCIPCVPVGCPECLCPCAARVRFLRSCMFSLSFCELTFVLVLGIGKQQQKTIFVEDAETAVKIISKARDDARIRLQVMER